MKLKKHIILLFLILVTEIPLNSLFSQNIQKPTRQSSFEAFSQGNFEKAYSQFRELLLTYSKDPLYKYYAGVCLIKLNKEPGEATNLLQQALQGAGSIKTLPPDGLFYLGRAQQMSGKFEDATASYNSYTEQAGKKTAKEMGVPEYLRQCLARQGQLIAADINLAEVIKETQKDTAKVIAKPEIREPVQKPVNKPVNKPVVKESLPKNYDVILGDAVEFQYKADSVTSILSGQKKEMEKFTGNPKTELKAKILENEKIAASFQLKADQKYREAQILLHPGMDTTKLTGLMHGNISDSTKKTENKIENKVDNKIIKAAKQSDTTKTRVPERNPQMEVFAFFDVAGKTETDPNAKIVIDPEVPPGLIYRIQVAVFRNPLLPSYFKGITPVYGFKVEGTDKIIYYAGMFRKSADARKALTAVKAKGFKDSFVVALAENKRVSTDRAAVMEKEWGAKPFYSIEKSMPALRADTITPTLIFRVQVIRSLKPLTEDVVEGIRKMAGSRGVDIQMREDGKIDYLVGKFITFDTAAEYADLLKRNGYRDTQVVSWLGKKEIPIETAKKLIDNLR